MHPCSTYRSTMKWYASAVFFFTVMLASESKVVDNSIVDRYVKCTSELRVNIEGGGKATLVKEARKLCKNDCREGTKLFSGRHCARICGLVLNYPPPGAPICELCTSDPGCYIKLCRCLIHNGVLRCVRDCERATPVKIGLLQSVSGTSGDIKQKFPSKILKFPWRKTRE